jgi:hypothetical protein
LPALQEDKRPVNGNLSRAPAPVREDVTSREVRRVENQLVRLVGTLKKSGQGKLEASGHLVVYNRF